MMTPAPGTPQFNDQVAVVALLTEEPHHVLTVPQAQKLINEAYATRVPPIALLLDDPAIRIPLITLLNVVGAELEYGVVDFQARSQWLREELKLFQGLDFGKLRQVRAIPMLDTSGKVHIVVSDPSNTEVRNYLTSRFPTPPPLVLAPVTQIIARLTTLEAAARDNALSAELERATPSDTFDASTRQPGGVIRTSNVGEWVQNMLTRAVSTGVSDIHLAFKEDGEMWMRFRKDGVLQQQPHPLSVQQGKEAVNSIMSRCSTIDTSNKLTPQDGTFSTTVAGRRIDARVSTIPNNDSVKLVVRILDSANMRKRLDDMGFTTATLTRLRRITELPQGLVMISGPTGSGKTTTLYGLLKEVDATSRNVCTAEDPIEYRLPYITQIQIRNERNINEERRLTFARALRSFMRQDPDVILIGEVRDQETASTAADAAITGHLVLTTVHASSALGIIPRLRELKVAPSILADAVSTLIAQRLVRRVHECAVEEPPTPEEIDYMVAAGIPVLDTVKHAMGCMACNSTGYLGRFAVAEMIEPSNHMRHLIRENADLIELEKAAKDSGYEPMLDAALDAVRDGHTTIAEVERVVGRAAK